LFEGGHHGSVGSGQIRAALAIDRPVVIGLAVRHGFDALAQNKDPNAVDDDINGASRAKHELLALGYNESGVLVENSWGTDWANGGLGRLSWRVVEHDVSEAYTIDGFANDIGPL
jgi:hypothetical protein